MRDTGRLEGFPFFHSAYRWGQLLGLASQTKLSPDLSSFPRFCSFGSSKTGDTCCGCKQQQKEKKTTDVIHMAVIHSPAATRLDLPRVQRAPAVHTGFTVTGCCHQRCTVRREVKATKNPERPVTEDNP